MLNHLFIGVFADFPGNMSKGWTETNRRPAETAFLESLKRQSCHPPFDWQVIHVHSAPNIQTRLTCLIFPRIRSWSSFISFFFKSSLHFFLLTHIHTPSPVNEQSAAQHSCYKVSYLERGLARVWLVNPMCCQYTLSYPPFPSPITCNFPNTMVWDSHPHLTDWPAVVLFCCATIAVTFNVNNQVQHVQCLSRRDMSYFVSDSVFSLPSEVSPHSFRLTDDLEHVLPLRLLSAVLQVLLPLLPVLLQLLLRQFFRLRLKLTFLHLLSHRTWSHARTQKSLTMFWHFKNNHQEDAGWKSWSLDTITLNRAVKQAMTSPCDCVLMS